MTNLILPLLVAATIPIRNPFWPIGFAGEKESISDKPKIQIKAATEATAEEDTKTSVTAEALAEAAEDADDTQYANKLWIAARKALKISSGSMRTEGGNQSVTINGRIYTNGDLISFNHEGRRFTWRVKKLTDGGTLKLQRVKYRELEDDNEKGHDL